MSFQNLYLSSPIPSLGSYLNTTQTLTLQNLNFIHRILELTHPKSITALCHTSFNNTTTLSLALFISPTPAIHHLLHTMILSISFQFCLRQGKQFKLSLLKTFTTSSLSAVPFIPLTFHVPNRFTPFRRVIHGGSRRSLLPCPMLDDALKVKKKQCAGP